jgi:hypothetical protein
LTYCWHIDGGECVSRRPSDTLTLSPGRHVVKLVVEDADWGTSASRTVKVTGS